MAYGVDKEFFVSSRDCTDPSDFTMRFYDYFDNGRLNKACSGAANDDCESSWQPPNWSKRANRGSWLCLKFLS